MTARICMKFFGLVLLATSACGDPGSEGGMGGEPSADSSGGNAGEPNQAAGGGPVSGSPSVAEVDAVVEATRQTLNSALLGDCVEREPNDPVAGDSETCIGSCTVTV